MSQFSSVLVTGASGFVGRHVVCKLAEKGCQVTALCNTSPIPQYAGSVCREVVYGDISEYDTCRRILKDIDVVCHAAAVIPGSYEDPSWAEECYRVNALSSLNLARCAVEKKIQRFIYISTANMYCPLSRPSIESDPIYPAQKATYYFTSKLTAELYINHICRNQQTDALILRIGTPYGPGEPGDKVIPVFMKQASRSMPLRVRSGGRAMYNFIYIEDAAEFVARSVQHGPAGIYNISSAEHTSLEELALAVAKVYSDKQVEIQIDPSPTDDFTGFAGLSIEKACKTWGYFPGSLLQGLQQYREYIEKRTTGI